MDGSRNLYIADTNNNQVLELVWNGSSYGAPNPIITGLSGPQGIAVDGSGNLYISNTGNHEVLKETLSGGGYTSSTVTSSTSGGPYGPVGVDVDSAGNVYIADWPSSTVYMETLSAGTYAQTTIGSGLSGPTGVAVDSLGNVYIAGYDSGQTYKETLSAGSYTQSTIGTGMVDPSGIAVDAAGNVYIADVIAGRVLEEPWTGSGYGTQLTLASGQYGDYGVAVDSRGNVYFANDNVSEILEISTSAGNFGAVNIGSTSSSVISPLFTFDSGGTIGSPVVLTQGAPGLDFSDAGSGSCTTNGTSHSYNPGDICTVDVTFAPRSSGTRNGAVALQDGSGNTIATGNVTGSGSGPQVNFFQPNTIPLPLLQSSGYAFNQPRGVALDGAGNLFVADTNNSKVIEFLAATGYSTFLTLGNGNGNIQRPRGITLDGSGNLFVADAAGSVYEIPSGCITSACVTLLGGGFISPYGVAVDESGDVFVADFNGSVQEIPFGCYLEGCVKPPLSSGWGNPWGIALDSNGNVFVSDHANNSVTEILAAGGYINTLPVAAANGNFNEPSGLFIDGKGNLFVCDTYDQQVKEVLATGGYATVLALNNPGTNYYYDPEAVAVDGSGNVFVTDTWNDRVVELDYADAPSLNFPSSTPVGSTDLTDGASVVTVENIGNAALTFSALSYPADFIDSGTSDCSVSVPLAAGTSCPLTISFAPTTTGNPLSEMIALTDNSLNAVASIQNIAVYGTATASAPSQTTPTIVWAPPSAINYGSDLTTVLTAAAVPTAAITRSQVLSPTPQRRAAGRRHL